MVSQVMVRNKLRYLDGERLFEQYVLLGRAGSYKQLGNFAVSKGWVNPYTGKAPTKMGLWNSMWRWALRNPDKAHEMYSNYVLELDGDTLTDDEWYSLIESRAYQCLSRPGYRKYLSNHPELKPYAVKAKHING